MESKKVFVGLDVGAKRIGVAVGDSIAKIAQPITTLQVGPNTAMELRSLFGEHDVTDIVVGRPRSQSGELSPQTAEVERLVAQYVQTEDAPLHWQDESVTSVIAEERLIARHKPYVKADIDAEAAAIILQDYLETL